MAAESISEAWRQKSIQARWLVPPAQLGLKENEIQVWRLGLDACADRIQQLRQLLSSDECERADRFHFAQHRDRFIVGRGTLRTILGQYLDVRPNCLQFQYGTHGKPSLILVGDRRVQFNLAHSDNLALVAIASDPVGIDVERIRTLPDAEQMAQRFFTAREYEVLRALPDTEQQAIFFRYWTCKEAYLKAIGSGLAYQLNQVEIELSKSARLHLYGSQEYGSQETLPWSLWELYPDVDYAAALAAQGDNWQISYWEWSKSINPSEQNPS